MPHDQVRRFTHFHTIFVESHQLRCSMRHHLEIDIGYCCMRRMVEKRSSRGSDNLLDPVNHYHISGYEACVAQDNKFASVS